MVPVLNLIAKFAFSALTELEGHATADEENYSKFSKILAISFINMAVVTLIIPIFSGSHVDFGA